MNQSTTPKKQSSEEEEYDNDNERHNGLFDTYYAYEKLKKTDQFTSQNQPHTTQHKLHPKASGWRNSKPNKPTKKKEPIQKWTALKVQHLPKH